MSNPLMIRLELSSNVRLQPPRPAFIDTSRICSVVPLHQPQTGSVVGMEGEAEDFLTVYSVEKVLALRHAAQVHAPLIHRGVVAVGLDDEGLIVPVRTLDIHQGRSL